MIAPPASDVSSSADGPRPPAGPPTLAGELRKIRADHRARRLEQVLVALRDRRGAWPVASAPPTGLLQAIVGFEHELADLRSHAPDGLAVSA